MADIALTAAQIAPVIPQKAEIIDLIAAAAITAGQAVYINSDGKAAVADASAAGTAQFRGIALKAAGAGAAVPVLKSGMVYGFTVSSLDGDAAVYLSDTAGALATTAGDATVDVIIGRVVALSDSSLTKVIYVDADWLTAYS